MEEVLDHNQEAEQIFRQYGRLLELVAAAQLPGRPEDAEECVQDAVWAFVEGRAPWDPAQGSKQTWLCVLVRSRAKDRRRALAARMEGDCALEDWCAAAGRLLKNGGRFALVHRPERLCDLFAALRSAGLEPKRLRMVQHDAAGVPGLVLLECRRGGKPGLRAEPALLLYDPDGRETAEHRRAYFREEEQAL